MIGTRPQIVDVYAGDGKVDFEVLAANGADGFCIKAGQGNWIDANFFVNWKNAKGVKPRQPYWLLDPRSTVQDHIDAILRALLNDPGETPLLQDYEANKSLGLSLAPINWLPQIDQAMLTNYNRVTEIYSNQNFLQLGGAANFAWLKSRDLFQAWYPWVPNAASQIPPILAPWITVAREWQYTENGRMPGAESISRDISVFMGTMDDFNKWVAQYSGTPIPVPAPVPVLTLNQRVDRLEAADVAHGWIL